MCLIDGKIPTPEPEEIAAIKKILREFPDAINFKTILLLNQSTTYSYQSSSNTNSNEFARIVVLIVGVLLAIIFAPVVVLLGMFNHFALKSFYEEANKKEEFKIFRKAYLLIFFGIFLLLMGASILSIILGINNGFAWYTWMYPVALVALNIGYTILGIIKAKQMVKDYPEIKEEQSQEKL